ncbi:hypothetical protein CH330_08275 [candidate division WOR-3 bacterium JGI_Cruoil_03_51_56]|uniref:Secretion system C-terminal sorting domain-containing protein n=1 Tax=candidate division WOR-3 bacterium JGI_Cruoil_03_51_56 TaxID=1973747 RepID=A0A235BQG6_UNCW3|nr:MAG: hypothetical protein CH330_08275 [candidate division WOR-3 bacterium JGI_Cruoil_03_51_56]
MRHAICCVVILVAIGSGQNWETSSILPGSFFAWGIGVDSDNLPHVAFGTARCLGYASRDSTGWNLEYPDSNAYVAELDLCLDSDGFPHIGYSGVRYAYWDGINWHTEAVAEGSGLTLALARDRTPHMVFVDSLRVKYTYKAGDSWVILPVPAYQADTLRRLGAASLALDTADRPGIAVTWGKHGGGGANDSLWLSFFEYDGKEWHRFDIDSVAGWAPWDFWRTRVRNDPGTGLFHIGYCRYAYAIGKGSQWNVEKGLWIGDMWCDFTLHQGRPHIACSSPMDPLKHQWRWAGGWETEPVGHVASIEPPSIAVDWTGRPHIAFNNYDSLCYARRLFVGTEEPAPAIAHPKPRLLVHPNPVLSVLTLEFPVQFRTLATITLCDVQGRCVGLLDHRVLRPGLYHHRFNLTDRAIRSGVYFIQIETASGKKVRKVVFQ